VEVVDMDGEGIGWGELIQVIILVDSSKPLPRGRKLKLLGNSRWVTFQYERLSKF
jgi:hypothetical protein